MEFEKLTTSKCSIQSNKKPITSTTGNSVLSLYFFSLTIPIHMTHQPVSVSNRRRYLVRFLMIENDFLKFVFFFYI